VGELEDRISGILNDPAQMAEIGRLARSLMGGEGEAPPPAAAEGPGELDPALLGRLSGLLKGGAVPGREQALLEAMKPWLSEKRRGKLERAMKLAGMARIARLALGEGGAEDV